MGRECIGVAYFEKGKIVHCFFVLVRSIVDG
jgi:hypothetical protein